MTEGTIDIFREPTDSEKKEFESLETRPNADKAVLEAKFAELNRLKLFSSNNIWKENLACFQCFWIDFNNAENSGQIEEYPNYLRLYLTNTKNHQFISTKFGADASKDEISFSYRCKASRINHQYSYMTPIKHVSEEIIAQLKQVVKTNLTSQELKLLKGGEK